LNNLPTETFMKNLREELKSKFPSINYSMAALGLIPRSAPIEITLSGSNLDLVMQSGNESEKQLSKKFPVRIMFAYPLKQVVLNTK
jgi:HAE1 family hydrophobic/amphiphilic exporter-1